MLGPDHPDTLTTRRNLARWLGEAGQPGQAANQFRDLLTDYLRVLGPDHPDTLTTRGNLAHWLGEAGQPGQAATQYRDLLADFLRVLGPDHPDTLTTRGNLAHGWAQAGQPAQAAAQFRDLLDRLPAGAGTRPPRHPHHPRQPGPVAGRGRAARPGRRQFRDLLDDYLRVLGPDHPDTLTTRDQLAYWQDRQEAGEG